MACMRLVDDLDQAGKAERVATLNELAHNLMSAFISKIYSTYCHLRAGTLCFRVRIHLFITVIYSVTIVSLLFPQYRNRIRSLQVWSFFDISNTIQQAPTSDRFQKPALKDTSVVSISEVCKAAMLALSIMRSYRISK
jgi:hypothetical protein